MRAVRAPFFTASVIPAVLGGVAAHYDGFRVEPGLLVLTMLGVVLAHAAANLINDFFDHLSGSDWINEHRSPLNGGSGVIQEGLLSPLAVVVAAVVMLGLAGCVGLALAVVRGWPIVVLMAIGGASALMYTGGPLRLAHLGLGELLIGINFGLLIVTGSYYVQVQSFGITPLLVSLPLTLLIMAVVYVNQYPDIEADAAVGKQNLVVRLGPRRALWGFYSLFAGAYGVVIGAVLMGLLPLGALLALAAAPLAVAAVLNADRHYYCPQRILPSCALTIAAHMVTGTALIIGLTVARWGVYGGAALWP